MTKALPALLTAVATMTASPALAATYQADFSTSALDPTLGYTGGTGYSLSSGGGFLTLTYSIPPSATVMTVNPSVYTRFDILGDYTADVTVDASGVPLDFGDGAGQPGLVAHDGANDVTALGIDRYASGTSATYFTDNSGAIAASGGVSAPSVATLQFQRVGKTLTASFAPIGSSSFTAISTTTDPSYGGPAVFTLSSYYNGLAGTAGVIRFSDFTITTPDAAAVPEPASWAAMSVGLGAVGWVARRRRRVGARPSAMPGALG